MREPAPRQLCDLLQRLGLATAADLQRVESTVHRLAGDLPRFQSIWIDALRQARLLTHFQATEIIAERGDNLRIGRYVLCQVVQECGYMSLFKAQDVGTRKLVLLATTVPKPSQAGHITSQLEKLVALGQQASQLSGLISSLGQDGSRIWAAAPWVDGTSLAEWMLHHGRFPPEVVLEIARSMLRNLAALETAGIVHGDIRVENVLLLPDGEVCLPLPGLRGAIRPHEGIAHCDLAPEACDTLAPERVAAGRPPTVASDLFACGCVWWQMLCGRPPLGGGDTLSRLRAAQTATIEDFRHWTIGVPAPLADAIACCLQKAPRERPRSMAALGEQLGVPRRGGRQAIARCLSAARRPIAPWLQARRTKAKKRHPHFLTAATLLFLAAIAIAWPVWVASNRPRSVTLTSQSEDDKQHGPANPASAASPRDARLGAQPNSRKSAVPRATERAVVQAGYNEPAAERDTLWLPNDRVIAAETLHLKPGMTVRPHAGRARVAVPSHGIAVRADRVTFHNIDFVVEESAPRPPDSNNEDLALVDICCSESTFVGCSFQSAAGRPDLSVAICWERNADDGAAASLPSGSLRIKDCIFRRVAAGILSQRRGAVALEIVNSLHLGPGPMLRFAGPPAADEPLRISLAQVTLREASALVEVRCRSTTNPSDRVETPVGDISIDAAGCILAPRDDKSVLLINSDHSPQQLLRGLKWSGQGSVLSPAVAFGRWLRPEGTSQAVDDSTMSISGLVRGQIDFAGPGDGNPAGSRVLECHAPLQDSDSLGANPATLPADVETTPLRSH